MPHYARCIPFARSFVLAGLAVLAGFPASAKVTRHDVIIMKNGDHMTGEVKKLENGVLYIATDYFSGSIGLDWLQVAKVESTGGFQIVTKDGKRTAGTIEKVSEEEAPGKDFEIHATSGEVPASSPGVVSIESQKKISGGSSPARSISESILPRQQPDCSHFGRQCKLSDHEMDG